MAIGALLSAPAVWPVSTTTVPTTTAKATTITSTEPPLEFCTGLFGFSSPPAARASAVLRWSVSALCTTTECARRAIRPCHRTWRHPAQLHLEDRQFFDCLNPNPRCGVRRRRLTLSQLLNVLCVPAHCMPPAQLLVGHITHYFNAHMSAHSHQSRWQSKPKYRGSKFCKGLKTCHNMKNTSPSIESNNKLKS